MKTSAIVLLLTLALTASAAPQGNNNRQQRGQGRGGNGGGQGNNSNGGNGGTKGNNNGALGSTTGGVNGGAAAGNSTGTNGGNVNGTAAANTTAPAQTGDPQTSLTLDPRVIAKGFANDGQDVPTAGQVASLTSTNNFINFCLTQPNLPLTDGKQITTGSCNPAPIGTIPSVDNMPSAKFTVPKNGDTLKANTAFTISMAIANMQTGAFVNAAENYFSAPQQLNAQGQIIGHSHVVVETLTALDQTTPLDPKKFAFFKGLNAAASGGILTADVTSGLPAGFYKLSSINTAANHQPVIVPIAQHGSLDDVVYFTITADGAPAAGAGGAAAGNGTATAGGATGAAGGAAAGNGTTIAGGATGGAAGNGGKGGKVAPAPAKGNTGSNNGGKGATNQNGNGRGRRMLPRMRF